MTSFIKQLQIQQAVAALLENGSMEELQLPPPIETDKETNMKAITNSAMAMALAFSASHGTSLVRVVESAKTATMVETLVWLDEPQLILLKSNRNLDMIAVAIPSENKEEFLFFACEITKDQYNAYMREKIDLLELFTHPVNKQLYQFDLAKNVENVVTLSLVPEEDKTNWRYWPKSGFYANNHTSDYGRPITELAVMDKAKEKRERKLQKAKQLAVK